QIPPLFSSFMSTHQLILTENYENELMADIFRFASLVILEIQKKFLDHLLLNAIQILNPKEWPRNKEELLKFGDDFDFNQALTIWLKMRKRKV
ncbi:8012_t:CDS:2, partial [Funneliformis mosseae]